MSYFRPTALDHALDWLGSQRDGRIVAGCTDLYPGTDRGFLHGPILDITAIPELKGVIRTDDGWRLGGTTTWTEIIRADLPPAFDCLKLAGQELGSPQIQNTGTLAGNICNASPAADAIPCLLTLDASVELTSIRGTRTLTLDNFITGPRQTTIADNEILTAVVVPTKACSGISNFEKLGARKYLVISIAMVATRLVIEDGIITDSALSVGSCSPIAKRLSKIESALNNQPADISSVAAVSNAMIQNVLSPIDDIRADANYRSTAATELVRRSLINLLFGDSTETSA